MNISKKSACPPPPPRKAGQKIISINHVLNQAINWRPQPLPDLMTSLHDVVCGKYRGIENAAIGLWEFELCPDYKRVSVPATTLARLPPEKRKRHLIKVMRQCKLVNSKIVDSTDATTHVIKPY